MLWSSSSSQASSPQPALILLDLMMPEMDGFQSVTDRRQEATHYFDIFIDIFTEKITAGRKPGM